MAVMTSDLAVKFATNILRMGQSKYAWEMAERLWPGFRSGKNLEHALSYLAETFSRQAGIVNGTFNEQAKRLVNIELKRLILEHLQVE